MLAFAHQLGVLDRGANQWPVAPVRPGRPRRGAGFVRWLDRHGTRCSNLSERSVCIKFGPAAMRIDDPQIPPERMKAFAAAGHWVETTSNEELERVATANPDKLALVDPRVRLTYAEYYGRARRLAARFIAMGLNGDDVVAIQLPNWTEFAIAA
ncbi:MAG: AMP-binding protein, partial [Alphaproteobacteria bacterium]|nr:AMP-binding protein [Alphaproteobacteria bacterium]